MPATTIWFKPTKRDLALLREIKIRASMRDVSVSSYIRQKLAAVVQTPEFPPDPEFTRRKS